MSAESLPQYFVPPTEQNKNVLQLELFRMKNNLIGNQIKLARLKHVPKLTQSELATRLQLEGYDINRNAIAKIEMGLRQVTDIEVEIFSKVLGVSVEWLFYGKE